MIEIQMIQYSVNGKPYPAIEGSSLSYEKIVERAGLNVETNPTVVYKTSVTGRDRILTKGQSVNVYDKAKFTAIDTGNA